MTNERYNMDDALHMLSKAGIKLSCMGDVADGVQWRLALKSLSDDLTWAHKVMLDYVSSHGGEEFAANFLRMIADTEPSFVSSYTNDGEMAADRVRAKLREAVKAEYGVGG